MGFTPDRRRRVARSLERFVSDARQHRNAPSARLDDRGAYFVSREDCSGSPIAQSLIILIYLRQRRRKPMQFDLTDLSLFRHVVEAGSITHGAERAHLALAAASTRIRHMEESVGAALLVRGRQGVTPTQAGRTLLQHARTILRQAERLREDLGAYAGGLAGQIRVLSNTNALTEFLPEALSSFLSTHPNVSVDLEERLSDEIIGQIAEGVADLGIVAATVDVSALETYPFRKDRFVLAVAHDHPLAKRSKVAFADVLR